MITLPNFAWLVQDQGGRYVTNVYSGSLGTDKQEGCLGKTIFSYKVFVKTTKEDGPVALYAEFFWQYPWNSGKENSDVTSKEFAVSEEGVALAKAWLEEEYTKG